jgi:hypothetical protein
MAWDLVKHRDSFAFTLHVPLQKAVTEVISGFSHDHGDFFYRKGKGTLK